MNVWNNLKKESASAIEEIQSSNAAQGVIVGTREGILGIISFVDTIREDADKLVKRFKTIGIRRIVMLTGDNERVAAAIAREVGLDDHYAELLPADLEIANRKNRSVEYKYPVMILLTYQDIFVIVASGVSEL